MSKRTGMVEKPLTGMVGRTLSKRSTRIGMVSPLLALGSRSANWMSLVFPVYESGELEREGMSVQLDQ